MHAKFLIPLSFLFFSFSDAMSHQSERFEFQEELKVFVGLQFEVQFTSTRFFFC